MASKVWLKKGGTARLVIEGFVDNDTITIPGGFAIEAITIKKSGTTAGNIRVGTDDNGQQIVLSTALSLSDGNLSNLTLVANSFRFNADTVIWLGVDSAATGTISVQIQKLF